MDETRSSETGRVWLLAAGYFACYVPYVILTKLLSTGGLVAGRQASGVAILPLSAVASAAGMAAFVTWRGWWRHADHASRWGVRVPIPDPVTAASGVATAVVIATTTLSYAVSTSVLAMMILMRGGVLVLAPIVDLAAGRSIRARSWGALALCLVALALGIRGVEAHGLDVPSAVVVVLYLAGYFVRLRAMTARGKQDDADAPVRFFVREQMVATPALLLFLGLAALTPTPWGAELREGFRTFDATTPWLVAIGVLSQGTGTFGALVLLDARENAFCVPLNRASSVLAGLVATGVMAAGFSGASPTVPELGGAVLLVGALLWLGWPARKRDPLPAQA